MENIVAGMKGTLIYTYRVTGAYLKGKDRVEFDRVVRAETGGQAMRMVIGGLAWNCSILGQEFFLLDVNCDQEVQC